MKLYRTHIAPADCEYTPSLVGLLLMVDIFLDTGENPNWKSREPYYDSLYCNVSWEHFSLYSSRLTVLKWDTYRTLYPLMSLHDPIRFADIVRGMIDIQKHEGLSYLPIIPRIRPKSTRRMAT